MDGGHQCQQGAPPRLDREVPGDVIGHSLSVFAVGGKSSANTVCHGRHIRLVHPQPVIAYDLWQRSPPRYDGNASGRHSLGDGAPEALVGRCLDVHGSPMEESVKSVRRQESGDAHVRWGYFSQICFGLLCALPRQDVLGIWHEPGGSYEDLMSLTPETLAANIANRYNESVPNMTDRGKGFGEPMVNDVGGSPYVALDLV